MVGALAIVLSALLIGAGGWRYGALFVIGALLGIALYRARFGFTSAYRRAIVRRDVSGVMAQLVLIGLTTSLFAPSLAAGEAFGRSLGGMVMPVGVQVAIGSFIFGVGMQLGGGCGSSTLYAARSGNGRKPYPEVSAFLKAGLHDSPSVRLPDAQGSGPEAGERGHVRRA